jgi:hypothetical protein
MMGRYYDVRLTEAQLKMLVSMGRLALGDDVIGTTARLDWLGAHRATEIEAARRAVDRLVEAQR